MPDVLVDEDLPRSLVVALRDVGLAALDVRDIGLRGRPDNEILEYAVQHNLTLLTADIGFGNLLRFPLGRHAGIGVARFPNEVSPAQLNASIVRALGSLTDDDIIGNLIVIEPERIRLRRVR